MSRDCCQKYEKTRISLAALRMTPDHIIIPVILDEVKNLFFKQ